MYFRMLKRDLTDKIGLNITLFIFMILASVFTVISVQLLYTSLVGSEKTYEICNTSDVILITDASISNKEGQRDRVEAWLETVSEYDRMYVSEEMIYPGTMVEYENGGQKEPLSACELRLTAVHTQHNIPYNLEDEPLVVSNGCVALPQNMMNRPGIEVGNTIQITTQMGKIFEFTIVAFYKEPMAYVYDGLVFSNEDYAVLLQESPIRKDVYEVYFEGIEGDYIGRLQDLASKLIVDLEDLRREMWVTKGRFLTNDGIMGLVVALALSLVGIFMLIMIFMTIHFSLKSTIKREEKEIGIMKAIGVYSFSYRALFALKYIAFAIVGGVIGIPVAMPLGKILMNRFMIHIILPSPMEKIAMAIIAVLFMVLIVVLFTFFSLRYMSRISVMDAIHGENRGESFRKMPGLLLHKKRRIAIPLFLAISDILGRVKRYSYLMLAYVSGICMVFLVIQIKDSICSMDYLRKYLQINAMDFSMEINDAYLSKLYEKYGNIEGVYAAINGIFEANDIPAKAEFFSAQMANVKFGEQEILSNMYFGAPDATEVVYVEGGVAPVLYNEVALAYLSAKQAGIELGDIITVEYDKYKEDHISYGKVTEEFVVTAFFDGQCWGVSPMIMGEQFDGALSLNGTALFQYQLDCPASEYEKYFEKMDALFTDEEIRFKDSEEAFDDVLTGFNTMFNLLIAVVSLVVAVVLVLITILYESIFIEEETGDVALLKSMGFDNGLVKWWHMLRMLLLVLLAYVFAVVFNGTIANYLIEKLVNYIIRVYDFQMITEFFGNFVVVPMSVTLLIVLCLLPVLSAMNKIQIWRIRDE